MNKRDVLIGLIALGALAACFIIVLAAGAGVFSGAGF